MGDVAARRVDGSCALNGTSEGAGRPTLSELGVRTRQQELLVAAGEELSFGASARLRVGELPLVPAVVGRLRAGSEDHWWISNETSTIGLIIDDETTPSRLSLAPGTACPIPFSTARLRFRAGAESFEVLLATPNGGGASGDARHESVPPSELRASLNEDQLLLLVGLCEPRLRQCMGSDAGPPTNRQVAHRVGWTVTKYNRKLDHLCQKLDRLGVHGLKGCIGQAAGYRKVVLVDYAISARLVSAHDLALLDERAELLARSA